MNSTINTVNTAVNDLSLVEDIEIRNKYRDHVEVMDKVKAVFMMPKINVMTTSQVADYYEVPLETIKTVVKRNRSELTENGMKKFKLGEMVEMNGRFNLDLPSRNQHYTVFHLSDDCDLKVPNAGIQLFDKRAVLNVGMLLQDSSIARQVRSALLDIEEAVEDAVLGNEQISMDIAEETKNLDPVPSISPDPMMIELWQEKDKCELSPAVVQASNVLVEGLLNLIKSTNDYCEFANQQKVYLENQFQQYKDSNKVRELEDENERLKKQVEELTSQINSTANRSALSSTIGKISKLSGQKIAYVWHELYQVLHQDYDIDLKYRGSAPYSQYIRDDEWGLVRIAIITVCGEYGINSDDVLW